ncbi:MAG: hypothetical protein H0V43_11425, partial [Gemmatimonadales bacterium]|nr:hypothetical protein [Gemmatimonadales bacterium]
MRRRKFLRSTCAGMLSLSPALSRISLPRAAAPWVLVPMDDAQADHLKAYGLA